MDDARLPESFGSTSVFTIIYLDSKKNSMAEH